MTTTLPPAVDTRAAGTITIATDHFKYALFPENMIFLQKDSTLFSLPIPAVRCGGAPCTVHKYTFANLTALKGTMVCLWNQSSEETLAQNRPKKLK